MKHPEGSLRPLQMQPMFVLALTLWCVGLIARLAPLFDRGGRLLRQFPSEDGYLMLTIARNQALGHGMSTAEGTLPTNGTQPLVTSLFALGYWVTDGDKRAGVLVALLIQIVIGVITAALIYKLGRRVFAERPWARSASLLASGVWFASPILLGHTMNCLETGAYGLMVAWVALLLTQDEVSFRAPWSIARRIGVGVVLGGAFWVRNDAAFLILATCVTYLLSVKTLTRDTLLSRLPTVLLFGGVSVVVAAPWMVSNYVNFGHVMPISGRSESMDAHFADNLHQVPAVLVEYFGLVLPVPWSLQTKGIVVVGCALIVVAAIVGILRLWPYALPIERRVILLASIFLGCLSTFYGLFFGAGYFMSRYLFPASPLIALLWAALMVMAIEKVAARLSVAPIVVSLGLVVLIAGLNARTYLGGTDHMHFEIVQWVEDNVPEDAWIGAVQTGTLGYFHDRTINLDGKVNPEALQARIDKRVFDYVVERRLEYLVDWVGMAHWGDDSPLMRKHYDVLVEDSQRNLGVLRLKP